MADVKDYKCKLREYFDDRTYGAEVANDCY